MLGQPDLKKKPMLSDLPYDELLLIFGKLSLLELISLSKTCKRFYDLISELSFFKNGIEELKEIYDGCILNIQYDEEPYYSGISYFIDDYDEDEDEDDYDEEFIQEIYKKNYSSFVLEAIDFRFHRIIYLNFTGSQITNKILTFICLWCKNLTTLYLNRCTGVTDVSCIGQCKMLTELYLYRCSNLTQENVDSLREKLPDCEITYS